MSLNFKFSYIVWQRLRERIRKKREKRQEEELYISRHSSEDIL